MVKVVVTMFFKVFLYKNISNRYKLLDITLDI